MDRRKLLIVGGIISVVALFVVICLAVFFWPRDNYAPQSSYDTANNNQSSTSEENRNSEQYALECVPRGHDNYRTQQTFAIDPNNNAILYLGVEFKGVFKSIDKGSTWKQITNGINAYKKANSEDRCYQEMGKIVIDPANTQRILLSRVESPGTINEPFSENAGVYLSENGGDSWKQLISGTMNASGSRAISFGSDSQTIFYGVNNAPASWGGADKNKFYNTVGTLYRSKDSGKTWEELKTGLVNYLRAMSVLVDVSNSKRIFLANFRPSGVENDRNLNPDQSVSLALSEDGGDSWQNISNRLPISAGLVHIVQSTKQTKNLFIIGQSIDSTKPTPNFYSIDGGVTFKRTADSIYAVTYDPHFVAGTRMISYQPYASKPGMYESLDAGMTWIFLSTLPSVVDHNKVRMSIYS